MLSEAKSLGMLAGVLSGWDSASGDGRSRDRGDVKAPRAKVVHGVGTRSLAVVTGGT